MDMRTPHQLRDAIESERHQIEWCGKSERMQGEVKRHEESLVYLEAQLVKAEARIAKWTTGQPAL